MKKHEQDILGPEKTTFLKEYFLIKTIHIKQTMYMFKLQIAWYLSNLTLDVP